MAENNFDGRCGSCIYLNTNDYVTGRDSLCKCTLRGQYYELNSKQCSSHKYDRGKDYYNLAKRARGTRFYVVTAIFNKLGLFKQ